MKRFWIIILACFLAAAVASWVFFSSQVTSKPNSTEASGSAVIAPEPAENKLAPVNVLLLGYGGAGHDGTYLSDTIIFLKVLPEQKRVLMFSIPRDLWVKVDFLSTAQRPYYSKINAIYSIGMSDKNYPDKPVEFTGEFGGGAAAKAVIGEIIGEPIDYFVGVDFAGFQRLLAILAGSDGLEVVVPYTFTDEWYPIDGEENNPCDFSEEEIAQLMETYKGYELEKQFACRYETISFTAGEQVLKPDEALKFVRSRHSSVGGNDFARSQRQQALLTALKNEVLTPSFVLKLPGLFNELSKSVVTDFGLKDLTKAIANYGDPRDFTLESYVLNDYLIDSWSADRQAILIPSAGQDNYTQIQTFIANETASASAALAE